MKQPINYNRNDRIHNTEATRATTGLEFILNKRILKLILRDF